MDRLKDIVAFVMAVMAVFSLIGAATQAFNNSIKSAGKSGRRL